MGMIQWFMDTDPSIAFVTDHLLAFQWWNGFITVVRSAPMYSNKTGI